MDPQEHKPHQNVGKLGDSGLKSRQIGAHVAMMGALAAEADMMHPAEKHILFMSHYRMSKGDAQLLPAMLSEVAKADPTRFTSSDTTVNKPTVQLRAVWATGGRSRRKKGKAARKARKLNRRKKC